MFALLCILAFNTFPDTIVVSSNVTDEISGGAYRKRANSYHVAVGSQSSRFSCYFEEYNDSTVGIRCYFSTKMSYRQQYRELQKIVHFASKNYDLTHLRYIEMRRLICTGDLAIDVTRLIPDSLDFENPSISYEEFIDILMRTRLATDINYLFSPYQVRLLEIGLEHPMFLPRRQLWEYSVIETDSTAIPQKIFDSMLYLYMK